MSTTSQLIPNLLGLGYGRGPYGEGLYGGTIIPYYQSLITSQYQNAPKFLALVAALLQPIDDLLPLVLNLDYSFDIDNAVGNQLDILGTILSTPRQVLFQPSNGVSPILDDPTYRILLKAKVAQYQWDGRVSSLQGIWKSLFPGGTIAIIDNQNMSLTVILTGTFTSIIQDLIVNDSIVPRPEGVLINFTFGETPFFGFDSNDQFVAGFDVGLFA